MIALVRRGPGRVSPLGHLRRQRRTPGCRLRDPIKPVTVRTVAVHPGTVYAASLTPLPRTTGNSRRHLRSPMRRTSPRSHRQKRAATGPDHGSGCPSAGFVSRRLTADSRPCCRARAVPVPPPAARSDAAPTAKRSRPLETACLCQRKTLPRHQTAWRVDIQLALRRSEAKQRLETAKLG
jgi:hypothetical protein